MTDPLYFSRFVSRLVPRLASPCLASCLLVVSLVLQAPAVLAVKNIPIDQGMYREVHEALGIDDAFGRWDETVRLVYDPDGAPSRYTNNTQFLALVEDAIEQWERVSGIHFIITGVDASVPNDRGLNDNQQDGLVRIFWGLANGAAGLAGPSYGTYDTNKGYFPFDDGSVELNNSADVIDSDFELVGVLAHELGHLLGLGHSDNPHSIMYANPYNHLTYPREDDIRAMQTLYGAPATAIDPATPLAAWVYTKPPVASSSVTQFLFKPNSFENKSAYLSLGSETITSVTAAAVDNKFVRLNPGGIGSASSRTAININATVIVVDPFGYVIDRLGWELKCAIGFNCGGGFIGLVQTHVVKTMPGNWKIYVVDESTGASNARLLLEMTLPVTTTGSYNHAPTAMLTASAGRTNSRAIFNLSATDPEGNNIEVVWRPPGKNDWNGDFTIDTDIRNTFASGFSASRIFDFTQTGTHTFFVEVRDDQPRYNGSAANSSEAGSGFQTLLKVTITLPVTASSLQVVSTQAASNSGSGGTSSAVLTAVAKTPVTQQFILTSDKTPTTASFVFGASKDQGVTTSTTFTTGNSVVIAGVVNPQAADVGKAANIFIAVRTTIAGVDTWTNRTSTGVFVAWNGNIASLVPAASVSSLKTSEAFEIYSGTMVAAQHRVYIGYRLSSSTVLHYTGQAMSLAVTN